MTNSHPAPTGKAKYAWTEIDRTEPPKRSAADRVHDFREVVGDYDEATAREQAKRCIQCPNPACVEACPLNCSIPELLALTADGRFQEAAEMFFATHHIPELASHACLGGRCCERDCILAGKSEAVPIRAITRFLLHYGWTHGLAEPAVATSLGRSVAVIGSGISGLVTADALSRKGYAVTVLDSRQKPGGRMMNGLPGFRVDTAMVERRVALLQRRGINFRMGVAFGTEVKLSDLRREFDAVYLAFGRAEPVALAVPGAELRGVCQAVSFLEQGVGAGCGSPGAQRPPADLRGKRVVVLGAGDTAMDAVRTAIRRGAADVLCLYRRDEASLPADAEEYAYAREEGGRFMFLTQPLAVLGNAAGEATHLRCVRTELAPAEGKRRPVVLPVAGSEFDVPADVVLVAFGFTASRLPPSDDFARLAVNASGLVTVDENLMTNLPGVFAAGAIIRGPLPLVEVVQDARKATDAIERYLSALPATKATR